MSRPFIIASQKIWNLELAKRLNKQLGRNFILIQYQEELTLSNIKKINPEIIFFPHWSSKIPKEIWENYESIVFHMTNLPYGRGGSPLQNLIANGHQNTKISALQCIDKLDAGPIYLKKDLNLTGTAQQIYERADKIIEKMIIEIINTHPTPQPQVGEAVYFKRRKPEDSNLKNSNSLENVFDMIRMLDAKGYPQAFLSTEYIKYEFTKVKKISGQLEAKVVISEINTKDES
ncbi:formyltransferase family protein [Legionella impletisoli]|uniref:Methionyl-tRNA formyltransferase n=1 Tax=Legionella impletisoli TaxID=343510 RepID=A0A917JUJ4_9GAMM|nr:formyltransferase family protein [Legionella impletisoli]GGI82098.1 hypothetical protein GCM10007966_08360 [Legionella impletisoli]